MSGVSPPPQYTAFLSYSHRDTTAAARLHRRLEAFRIDKTMVGQNAVTLVSASLRPIFRDRSDFSAGDALAEQTHSALDNSAALIVIASPDASRSHYVDAEVRLFRTLHPTRPIIPVIVSGPRNVAVHDVFPPSLCVPANADEKSAPLQTDLLAADAREESDGEELAVAKIVARLIGAHPDQVFRRFERERKRQARVRLAVAGVVGILIALTSSVTMHALHADRQINDAKLLAAQLLGVSSANAAEPDAVENLTQAITAISQNSSTDARYTKALAFLQAGKPDKAAELLQQVARQASANVEHEKARAADAYYNLGTIAGLADPRKARWAFAEAAGLEPDDVRNLLSHGYFEKHAGNLDEAERSYKRVLTLAEPAGKSWALFSARIDLGDVFYERGDLATAMSEYVQAAAIADHESRLDPASARAMRAMSLSYRELGNVVFTRGNLPDALAYFHAELDLAARLVKFQPANPLRQRDLSRSLEKFGNVLAAQGDLQSALSSYRESLRIARELVKSDPRNLWWQHDLVRPIGLVGNIQLRMGQHTEALRAYNEALTIGLNLARKDQDNREWQDTLAECHRNVGRAAMAQGNSTLAADSFNKMLSIAQKLVNNDPKNLRWQHLQSSAYEYIARVYKRMGDLSATLWALRSGHAIIARLSHVSPDNADWRDELNWFERQLASLGQ